MKTTTESELRELAKTMSAPEIAEHLGCCQNYVFAATSLLGIKLKRKNAAEADRPARFLLMLECGASVQEIAKKEGASIQTVYSILRRSKLATTPAKAMKAKLERMQKVEK